MDKVIKIGNTQIGFNYPTYFIADIGSNHDGDLSRAKDLIYKCHEAGANAAKFQNFFADTLVSDYGFNNLNNINTHQSSWNDSVFETYKKASVPLDWTKELFNTCKEVGIDYFTSVYDINLINYLSKFMPAWKIGSGDITYSEMFENLSKTNKPIIFATGASTIEDVKRCVNILNNFKKETIILQCNTNYTSSYENFKYINLNVLNKYNKLFPDKILGLSDHTAGHTTVLGAITLGARVIEKHFTDDNNREGCDHNFALNPKSWRNMIDASRELEQALGDDNKKIETNEIESIIVQRRATRASRDLNKNSIIAKNDLAFLRPAPEKSIDPYNHNLILGKKINRHIKKGDLITLEDIK